MRITVINLSASTVFEQKKEAARKCAILSADVCVRKCFSPIFDGRTRRCVRRLSRRNLRDRAFSTADGGCFVVFFVKYIEILNLIDEYFIH